MHPHTDHLSSPTTEPLGAVRKPREIPQQRRHRAPDHLQELEGILNPFAAETAFLLKGWVRNRYSFYNYQPGGRNYGIPMVLRMVLARLFDAIRLTCGHLLPLWMERFVELDSLSNQQLAEAYRNMDWMAVLDIGGLSTIIERDDVPDPELIKVLSAHLEVICRKRKAGVGVMKFCEASPMHLGHRDASKAVKSAFESALAEKGHKNTVIPLPGVNSRILEKWMGIQCSQVLNKEEFDGYYSLTFAKRDRALLSQSCVKGGTRA